MRICLGITLILLESRAGVWGLDSEKLVECYGIHVLGSKIQDNGAVRINGGNFEIIEGWLKDFKDISTQ